MKFKDLTGITFNRLTVVEQVPTLPNKPKQWLCRCVCGQEKVFLGSNITQGRSKSCGCLRVDQTKKRYKKIEKVYNHPLYVVWKNMLQTAGRKYIKVCDEWSSNFNQFIGDMGPKPSPQHAFYRKDANKGYSKDNCAWLRRLEFIKLRGLANGESIRPNW